MLGAWILFSTSTDARKPDILFIAIDDMNDWTTLFDQNNPIQTPNLERLAARGTFFNRAYCASPGCNPSRTAIMTGLRPTTSGVYHNGDAWRTIIPDAVSLPEYLAKEGGYQTLGAGKIYHHGHTGAEPEGRRKEPEWFSKERGVISYHSKAELFNLKADPQQTRNLFKKHPEKAKELKALLDKSRKAARSR